MIYVAILEGLVLVMTIAAFAVTVWRVKHDKQYIGSVSGRSNADRLGTQTDADKEHETEGQG